MKQQPSKTILYIEDNPSNATLVKRILQHHGHRVIIAETGLKGIDMALEYLPDLILMDINLPDLSGRECTTRLRAFDEFKATPIIALTALTDERQRAMTLVAGVTGYITKPFDIIAFPERLQFYLDGGRDSLILENPEEAQQDYYQELVKHLEQRLRDLESTNWQLRQLDRIKDDFITRTAHELRTPLTTIYGYSRLLQSFEPLQEFMGTSPESAAYLDGLVESIERLHDVVNEILTIYRLTTEEVKISPSLTNLKTLVKHAANDFTHIAAQRQIELKLNLDDGPEKCYTDNSLLKLAITNLIGNAIKYTPDGGVVTVEITNKDQHIKISVTDTGIGIPLEEQDRIFDQFYSLQKVATHSSSKTAFRGGGLGLGLSIAKSIAEAHSGTIGVKSAGLDETNLPGSTFWIDIPFREKLMTRTTETNVVEKV